MEEEEWSLKRTILVLLSLLLFGVGWFLSYFIMEISCNDCPPYYLDLNKDYCYHEEYATIVYPKNCHLTHPFLMQGNTIMFLSYFGIASSLFL